MAAWSMTRWQSSGQSCISPSMAFSPPNGMTLGPAPRLPEPAPRLPGRRCRATASQVTSWQIRTALPLGCEPQSAKAVERKTRDILRRPAAGREIGQDFTDHRRKFEAVAGAGRGHDDIRRIGDAVDEEIAVRGHGVE